MNPLLCRNDSGCTPSLWNRLNSTSQSGSFRIHQLTQCLDFLVGEDHFRMLTAQTQRVVEEHSLHFHHVDGRSYNEFATVLGFRADHPQHELVFLHGGDVAVHPCGHASMHVRVASFQHQADSHAAPPFLRSMQNTVESVALMRYRFPSSWSLSASNPGQAFRSSRGTAAMPGL